MSATRLYRLEGILWELLNFVRRPGTEEAFLRASREVAGGLTAEQAAMISFEHGEGVFKGLPPESLMVHSLKDPAAKLLTTIYNKNTFQTSITEELITEQSVEARAALKQNLSSCAMFLGIQEKALPKIKHLDDCETDAVCILGYVKHAVIPALTRLEKASPGFSRASDQTVTTDGYDVFRRVSKEEWLAASNKPKGMDGPG